MTSHCKTTGSRTETKLSHSAYRDPEQRHPGQKIASQKGYKSQTVNPQTDIDHRHSADRHFKFGH